MAEVLRAHGVTIGGGETQRQLSTRMRDAATSRGIPPEAEHILVDLALTRVMDNGLRMRIKDAYRPPAPDAWDCSGKGNWLNNEDIGTVMHQYEVAMPDFKFLGAVPIDFADRPSKFGGRCVTPAMCALDVKSLISAGVTKHLGVILNMDKHDSRGSHWVAVYIGLDPHAPNYGVFYYDSVANVPGERVVVWMKSIANAVAGIRQHGHVFRVERNTIRRQFGHSECGVFSLMFLIHCMQRQSSFRDICRTLGGDEVMLAMRKVLFRPALASLGVMMPKLTSGGARARARVARVPPAPSLSLARVHREPRVEHASPRRISPNSRHPR